ncbi:MAG: HEAT repeat domain-containing protein [Phycisphaerae bacterium]
MLAALAAVWLPARCSSEPDAPPAPGPSETSKAAGGTADAPAPEALRERIRILARGGTRSRPEIEPFLEHPHPAAREEAALAYPRVAEGTAAPALARLATADPVRDVRAAAVTAIGHMRAMDEMDAILRALEDPDGLVRRRAAEAASRITGQRYDVNVSPEAWRRTVEEIRALWQNHGATLRTYHERHTPSGRR